MEVVEEAEEAVLHLLNIRYISQEGVLDGGGRLALVLGGLPPRTQLGLGLISHSPPALALLAGVSAHVVAVAGVSSPGRSAVFTAGAAARCRRISGRPGTLSF